MVLMVQKEVAERIIAKDGKESLLSISIKAYGDRGLLLKFRQKTFHRRRKLIPRFYPLKTFPKDFLIRRLAEIK